MTENFLNLVKEIDIQVQEVQKVPDKMNPKRPTPRHIIIKMLRLNTKNHKSRKRKTVTYKEASIRVSVDCSTETLQGKRD